MRKNSWTSEMVDCPGVMPVISSEEGVLER